VGHDALNLDILPSPFSRSADKVEDNNKSTRLATNPIYTAPARPLLHDEDVKYSMKNANGKHADELRDDDFVSKRLKLSSAIGCSTSSSSHYK
jgi:hypothetical protein